MKYVLGLGSNLGVPVYNLRQAVDCIEAVGCKIIAYSNIYKSKAFLKPNAPKAWDLPFFNAAVLIDTALTPLALLEKIKIIEMNMGRTPADTNTWLPRIIDIDILVMETGSFQSETLSIPHKELLNRQFALTPLFDVLPGWHPANMSTQDIQILMSTLAPCFKLAVSLSGPMMMGICNLTNDSFTEIGAGKKSISQSFQEIQNLVLAGAHIIDIGAESTGMDAKGLNDIDDITLLEQILDKLDENKELLAHLPLVSIDTRKLSVIRRLLEKYPFIWMINDVEASDLIEKAQLVAQHQVKYVLTHNLGVIGRTAYLPKETAIEQLLIFFNKNVELLKSYHVKASQIYLDVGFGYGKDKETSQIILNNLSYIKPQLGLPLLIGHSRKPSVIGVSKQAGIKELDAATQQLSLWLAKNGADVLRVHTLYVTTDSSRAGGVRKAHLFKMN